MINVIDIVRCPECHATDFKIMEFQDASMNITNLLLFDKGDGIMLCSACKSWYPIKNGIPELLSKDLRNKENDDSFIKKYDNIINDEIKSAYLK